MNSDHLLQMKKGAKREKRGKEPVAKKKLIFRERLPDFSLKYSAIRLSAVFGTRRKVALRGAGYTWTPDLRSFGKLREVGVSPYLGFTIYLSVFQCFGWFEALNGRLIGPKTWDRIIGNFLNPFVPSITRHGLLGLLIV